MNIKCVITLFVIVVRSTECIVIRSANSCPAISPMPNFDGSSLNGVWNDLYLTDDDVEIKEHCLKTTLAYNSTNKSFNLKSQYYNQTIKIENEKLLHELNQPGMYTVNVFQEYTNTWKEIPWFYVFLGTTNNFKTYLLYVCNVRDDTIYGNFYIRSQLDSISKDNFQTLKDIAKLNGNNEQFQPTDRTDCEQL